MSLKKFEIQEMIAKGGMAEVYLARTVGLEGFAKDVCVKKILPHLTEDQTFVSMFIDEAKLAATLNYANIVQVHDLCVSADREYFIVMEYVHGKDLSDVIRAAQLAGRELPPDIAAFIARESLKGLYYAHKKTDSTGAPLNIIHRDVSPQNVLLSYMGEVKITDFGIAKASSSVSKTAVGILKGKYGYMSPEQARGERLDARSDIFNLGIVLYEMLVGERCFAGASDYSTLNLMREAKVTPPSKINKDIPKELEAIVLKALARKPEDRYQDALEFEGALAAWAKTSGHLAHDTDLARFMRELFKDGQGEKRESRTGVIQLSSVVEPVPAAPPEAKKPAPEPARPAEARAAESSPRGEVEEPGREALERAKKRKATKTPEGAAVSAPEPAAPAEPRPKAESAPKAESRPKAEADPKPEEKAAESAPKKLARIKPEAGEEKPAKKAAADDPKDDKKRQKEEARAARKPVGRRDLKPNLTELQRLGREGGRPSYGAAGLILLLALAGGVGAGFIETRQTLEQHVFRAAELEAAEESAEGRNVEVYITTTPAGAKVWLDGNALADKTPLLVARPRDGDKHSLKMSLAGYETLETQFEYADGALTMVEQRLTGGDVELAVYGKPSGLEVRVDGKVVGVTPLSIDVAPGPHVVEVGGGERELIVKEIVVEPGKKLTLEPSVPKRGGLPTLDLRSAPTAQVFIDGRPLGETNGSAFPLEPDVRHTVLLVEPGTNRRIEFQVELAAGELRRMFLDLLDAS